jgi:hypothetical protein
MKNNLFPFVAVAFLIALTSTSCSKENSTFIQSQKIQDFQKDIIGSWQLVEKGVEVAMHEGHVCTDPQNMAADKVTYVVKWENAVMDEKRDFQSGGNYDCYWTKQLSCKGSYKISNNGVLEVNNNCQNYLEKVETLTITTLIVKEGNLYFKFKKADY